MKQQILYRDEKGRYVSTTKFQSDHDRKFKEAMKVKFADPPGDEEVKEKIAEYLKDHAWIEDEPKHGVEETHIRFSRSLETIGAVSVGLIWVLIFVVILYIGVRI